ncbi:hypothetical protein [Bacillus sp. T33-2]|uniref:hypothetical protein n=1 Tax=Bacillus sp. T33-2 TaxID=2054168 RepID=UPI000C76CC6F|nr:hypothetical protein [Bacillus sp. T33-2]PLR99590.1 hypothetical protein CVD19_00575 [Bacillus sp. T33-2]
MIVGTVISKDNGLHVVTRVINDSVIMNTQPLEEYISRNVMIKYGGEFKTIKEIIDIESDKYLSNRKVIDV